MKIGSSAITLSIKNGISIYVAHGKNVVISNNIAEESFWSGIQ